MNHREISDVALYKVRYWAEHDDKYHVVMFANACYFDDVESTMRMVQIWLDSNGRGVCLLEGIRRVRVETLVLLDVKPEVT